MTGMKKMDHEYRNTDEYKLFIDCLKYHGVHESLHDVAIMAHLADPFLYKKLKKTKGPIEPLPERTQFEYQTMEIKSQDIVNDG